MGGRDFCSFLVSCLFPFLLINVEDLEEAALDQKRRVQLEVRAQTRGLGWEDRSAAAWRFWKMAV